MTTYRTQNARLMRRLGFTRNIDASVEIIPSDKAAYWRHQPSNALVITMHETRCLEPQIVRAALYNAVYQTMRKVTDKVCAAVGSVRSEHELGMAEFEQKRRAKKP